MGVHGLTIELVAQLGSRFPGALREGQLDDVERIAFHYEQVRGHGKSIADPWRGIALFSLVCAAQGMQTWLIDKFAHSVNESHSVGSIGLHQEFGVDVIETDVSTWWRFFESESLDIVTCFESMEHWHSSPQSVWRQARETLMSGGLLLISVPKCCKSSKEIVCPRRPLNLGRFEDWYYPVAFGGHVRELTLPELVRAVEEAGFLVERPWRRNWRKPKYITGWLWTPINALLRAFPTLCSTLYVRARKPKVSGSTERSGE